MSKQALHQVVATVKPYLVIGRISALVLGSLVYIWADRSIRHLANGAEVVHHASPKVAK